MLIYLEAAAGILAAAYALIGLMWLYSAISLRLQARSARRCGVRPGRVIDLDAAP